MDVMALMLIEVTIFSAQSKYSEHYVCNICLSLPD